MGNGPNEVQQAGGRAALDRLIAGAQIVPRPPVAVAPPPPDNPPPPRTESVQRKPPLRSRLMSDIPPELVHWLWQGRIPLGMLSLVEGEPDMGKSTLLLDIAARVTTGRPMPFENAPDEASRKPSMVILWAPEDAVSQVIRPRLDAAGASVSLVRHIDDPLTLPDDIDRLEEMVVGDGARLLIIEPLTGALSGKVDSFKDHDVRRALQPLADMAKRTGAAVVAIRHLRKGNGPAIHRGGGSIAIGAVARAVLCAGKDPADETVRVIARTKGNLALLPPALRYRFEPVGHVARVEWLGECSITADELLAVPDKKKPAPMLNSAIGVLRQILKGDPVPAADVEEQAAEADVSKATLRRAKEALGVCYTAAKGGSKSGWLLSLPVSEKLKRTNERDAQDGRDARDAQEPHLEHLAHLSTRPDHGPGHGQEAKAKA